MKAFFTVSLLLTLQAIAMAYASPASSDKHIEEKKQRKGTPCSYDTVSLHTTLAFSWALLRSKNCFFFFGVVCLAQRLWNVKQIFLHLCFSWAQYHPFQLRAGRPRVLNSLPNNSMLFHCMSDERAHKVLVDVCEQ
ncbi:hypothetical protein JOM56_005508 [Amanita muscaria]